MNREAGYNSWSINSQVETETDDSIFFGGEGEPIFRVDTEEQSSLFGHIPMGTYRTLADANVLLANHQLDVNNWKSEYFKLCDSVAFVGLTLADAPRANGSNTLTLVSSRIHKKAVNCWGAIKYRSTLWFVLDLVETADKKYYRPFITPMVCAKPPQRARIIPHDDKENILQRMLKYKTAHEELKAPQNDPNSVMSEFPRMSMYAGKVHDMTCALTGSFETRVPAAVVLASRSLEERKAALGKADRFEMVVGGRPDLS